MVMTSDSDEESAPQASSDEELTSSEPEEETDRSFGQQYEALLNTVVPPGKCPILCFSKIPQKLQKQKEKQNQQERQAVHLSQTKKQLLNSFHKGVADFDVHREAQVRKQATRGVIAIFNSNSKAKSQPQLLEPVKEEEVPQRSEEFLDLIMKAAVKHGK
jgi:hypothetical protein